MERNIYCVFSLIAEDGRNNDDAVHQRFAKNWLAENFAEQLGF